MLTFADEVVIVLSGETGIATLVGGDEVLVGGAGEAVVVGVGGALVAEERTGATGVGGARVDAVKLGGTGRDALARVEISVGSAVHAFCV